MRCAGLTCKKQLLIPALVLVVLAVTGIAFNFRGCKSVKLNFPSCNSSNVNDMLANATSNWIKALDSNLTWKLKVTIEITKKLLSSKPTAASEWRDMNLTLVPSSEAIPSISYIHSSAFSRGSLSSKVLSLIKFSTPVADSTETFLSAPRTSTFTSSLFNRFTIGNPPSGSSPTSVPNAPSGPLFDHSLPSNEATASAQSPIQPVIALVSSPVNSSPQTYMHSISSVYPSTLHLSSASVPYFLPLDQTSKSPTFFAPPATAKTSILQSYLSPLHVSPISITLLGEPSRESSQHAHRGPSSPFSYSALTPLNGGSMPPQMIQSSAQILSPADVHPPKQAPSPLTSVTKDIYSPSLQLPLYVASPNILHSQPPSLASKTVSVLAPHQAPSISSPATQPLSPTSSISVREKHALSPSELSFRVPAPSLHPHTMSKPLVAPLHSIHHYPVFPPLLGRKSPLPAIVDWPPSFQISPVVAPELQMFGDNSRTSSQHSLKRNAHRPQAPLLMHGINSEVPPTSTPHASTSPTTDLRPRHLQQPRAPLQPAPVQENATAPSPPEHDSAHVVPIMPPRTIYFPPPPNSDCHQTCVDPYTSTPPGSACGCVLPMLVGLELGTTLYSLFPLVSELAQEVAEGAFLSPSQVHIMGANTVSDNLDKTEVEADMVPLGLSFDHTTAVLIAQRFWSHQVFINETLFGNYSVLYIKYPGLPPSPPSRNSVGPNSGKMKGGNEASYSQPLSVDVAKSNSRLSGEILAIVMISCIIAAITFLGVKWLFFLRSSHYRMYPALIKPAERSSMTKRAVLSSSLGSSESMSFASSLTANSACSKKFTLAELEKATKNFRRENVIGEGGFGRVYRGTLEDSTKVAVKVLTRDDEQGVREFAAEVEMLSRLHHRNLVKLVGTCIEENVRCLVYELIPNGSVEFHLHGDHKRPAPLSWEVRLKIALGSARGLAYLHEDSNPRVIHRDFKSSNILLENDFNPKVSDFGLAKAASDEVGGHVSTRVMGTFGYVAPEYAMTGHLLVKSDVYSYGVVLLELLSGRKPVNISGLPGEENLVTWARPLLRSKEGLKTLGDPNLGDDVPFHNFVKVAAIASMCVHPEVAHRPFMGEVVQALKLVYNDSETSDGAPSRNNSLSAEFPLRNHDSKTTPVDALRSSLIYLPDDSSFITVDYDSGPLDTPNKDFRKPSSASAILSNSGRFVKQISGSFRNSSGPLKIVRSNPEWYRFRHSSRDSVSDHGMDIGGSVKYHTDVWP